MPRPTRILTALGFAILTVPVIARGDWVELRNNDIVRGKVVSLDERELKLKSENFGEMTIPRDKVSLVGLGDRPMPAASQPAATLDNPPQGNARGLPSLTQNPQLSNMLQDLLGEGGVAGLQQNLEESRRGLKELQKDLGEGPAADALDSYGKIFELLGGLAPSLQPTPESPSQAAPDAPAEAPLPGKPR